MVWIIVPYIAGPNPTNQAQGIFCWSDYYALHYMIGAWSQAEIIRFVFYSSKKMQTGIFGHLRYNMFLVMYPTGVLSEFLCVRDASAAVA